MSSFGQRGPAPPAPCAPNSCRSWHCGPLNPLTLGAVSRLRRQMGREELGARSPPLPGLLVRVGGVRAPQCGTSRSLPFLTPGAAHASVSAAPQGACLPAWARASAPAAGLSSRLPALLCLPEDFLIRTPASLLRSLVPPRPNAGVRGRACTCSVGPPPLACGSAASGLRPAVPSGPRPSPHRLCAAAGAPSSRRSGPASQERPSWPPPTAGLVVTTTPRPCWASGQSRRGFSRGGVACPRQAPAWRWPSVALRRALGLTPGCPKARRCTRLLSVACTLPGGPRDAAGLPTPAVAVRRAGPASGSAAGEPFPRCRQARGRGRGGRWAPGRRVALRPSRHGSVTPRPSLGTSLLSGVLRVLDASIARVARSDPCAGAARGGGGPQRALRAAGLEPTPLVGCPWPLHTSCSFRILWLLCKNVSSSRR